MWGQQRTISLNHSPSLSSISKCVPRGQIYMPQRKYMTACTYMTVLVLTRTIQLHHF